MTHYQLKNVNILYAVVQIVIQWHLEAVSHNSGARILQKSRSYLNISGASVW